MTIVVKEKETMILRRMKEAWGVEGGKKGEMITFNKKN